MTGGIDDGGLDIILHSSASLLEETQTQLDELHVNTSSQTDDIAALESRTDRLLERLRIEAPLPAAQEVMRPHETERKRQFTEQSVLERAAHNLRSRGIDPDSVQMEELIDAAEVARIRRRFSGEAGLSARLDRTDLAMAIVGGLVGGLVDTLLVRTPATSALTKTIKQLALPSDNWLAKLAEVPYDLSWNYELWLTPGYHRVQTVGHDPLLGLIWGTADILRQTCTGLRPDGTLALVGRAGDYPTTWPAALARQILHTLSDVPTPAGVPLPGWSVLAALPPTIEGDRNLAQKMYGQGYDSWHFMTMATAPAAVELLCRSYWAVRRSQDADFAADVPGPVADQPRYQALSLVAHGVSAGVDLGAFVATGSNPLTLNYAQWLVLAKKVAAFAGRERHPDQAEIALANQRSLETGWPVG